MKLNKRETATVLHALRIVQAEGRLVGCAAAMCDHFEENEALTNAEIDALCEWINCDDDPATNLLESAVQQWRAAIDDDEPIPGTDAVEWLVQFVEQAREVLHAGNVPCMKCGRTDLPLHVNRYCPECFEEPVTDEERSNGPRRNR